MDYATINSITKYPSIPTWHVMDQKGQLGTETNGDPEGPWELTEKIDGTNARLIILLNFTLGGGLRDWLIGSREELLTAKDDRIWNPSMGIVNVLRAGGPDPRHQRIAPFLEVASGLGGVADRVIVTVYGEVYGWKINRAKAYTLTEGSYGFRVFDVRTLREPDLIKLEAMNPSERSLWRESNADLHTWYPHDDSVLAVARESSGTVPVLGTVDRLPVGLEETRAFIAAQTGARSRGWLDEAGDPVEAPEGLVARTKDRSRIVKLRSEDYRRTLEGKRRK